MLLIYEAHNVANTGIQDIDQKNLTNTIRHKLYNLQNDFRIVYGEFEFLEAMEDYLEN